MATIAKGHAFSAQTTSAGRGAAYQLEQDTSLGLEIVGGQHNGSHANSFLMGGSGSRGGRRRRSSGGTSSFPIRPASPLYIYESAPATSTQYDPFLRVSGIKQQQQLAISPPGNATADLAGRPKSGSKILTRGTLLVSAYSSGNDNATNTNTTPPPPASTSPTRVTQTRPLSAGASRPKSAGHTRSSDRGSSFDGSHHPVPTATILTLSAPQAAHTTHTTTSTRDLIASSGAGTTGRAGLSRPRSASYGQQPALVSPRLRGGLTLETAAATAASTTERVRPVRPLSANPSFRQAGGAHSWNVAGVNSTGHLVASGAVGSSGLRQSNDGTRPHTAGATPTSATTSSGVEALLNKLFGNLVITAGSGPGGANTTGAESGFAGAYNSGVTSGASINMRPRSGDPKTRQLGRTYSWGASSSGTAAANGNATAAVNSHHFYDNSMTTTTISGWESLDNPILAPRGSFGGSNSPFAGATTTDLIGKISPPTVSIPVKSSPAASSSSLMNPTKQPRLFLSHSVPAPDQHAASNTRNFGTSILTLNAAAASAGRPGRASNISAKMMDTIVSYHAAANTASARAAGQTPFSRQDDSPAPNSTNLEPCHSAPILDFLYSPLTNTLSEQRTQPHTFVRTANNFTTSANTTTSVNSSSNNTNGNGSSSNVGSGLLASPRGSDQPQGPPPPRVATPFPWVSHPEPQPRQRSELSLALDAESAVSTTAGEYSSGSRASSLSGVPLGVALQGVLTQTIAPLSSMARHTSSRDGSMSNRIHSGAVAAMTLSMTSPVTTSSQAQMTAPSAAVTPSMLMTSSLPMTSSTPEAVSCTSGPTESADSMQESPTSVITDPLLTGSSTSTSRMGVIPTLDIGGSSVDFSALGSKKHRKEVRDRVRNNTFNGGCGNNPGSVAEIAIPLVRPYSAQDSRPSAVTGLEFSATLFAITKPKACVLESASKVEADPTPLQVNAVVVTEGMDSKQESSGGVVVAVLSGDSDMPETPELDVSSTSVSVTPVAKLRAAEAFLAVTLAEESLHASVGSDTAVLLSGAEEPSCQTQLPEPTKCDIAPQEPQALTAPVADLHTSFVETGTVLAGPGPTSAACIARGIPEDIQAADVERKSAQLGDTASASDCEGESGCLLDSGSSNTTHDLASVVSIPVDGTAGVEDLCAQPGAVGVGGREGRVWLTATPPQTAAACTPHVRKGAAACASAAAAQPTVSSSPSSAPSPTPPASSSTFSPATTLPSPTASDSSPASVSSTAESSPLTGGPCSPTRPSPPTSVASAPTLAQMLAILDDGPISPVSPKAWTPPPRLSLDHCSSYSGSSHHPDQGITFLPASFNCPVSPRSLSPGSKQLRKGGGSLELALLKTGSPKIGGDIAAVDFGFSLNLGQYQLSAGPRLQSPRSVSANAPGFRSDGGGGGSPLPRFLSRPNWGSCFKAAATIAAPLPGETLQGDSTAGARENSTEACTLSAEPSAAAEGFFVRQAHPSAQLMDDLLVDVADVASMFGLDSNWMAHLLHP